MGANANGGGVAAKYVNLTSSTISGNRAVNARAGGAYNTGVAVATNSLIAGNTAGLGNPDLTYIPATPPVKLMVFTLVGDKSGTSLAEAPVGAPDIVGNLIGGPVHGVIDPLFAPLAYNGGPTLFDGSKMLTQAPLSGSPAIGAGDPLAVVGTNVPHFVPASDQRGAPFTRIFGGRIDMGAVEVEPAGFLVGDYNRNGIVDAADYTVWRDSYGQVGPNLAADSDGDQLIGQFDYNNWVSNFGHVATVTGSGASVPEPTTAVLACLGLLLLLPLRRGQSLAAGTHP
jgi:hypothetical protein